MVSDRVNEVSEDEAGAGDPLISLQTDTVEMDKGRLENEFHTNNREDKVKRKVRVDTERCTSSQREKASRTPQDGAIFRVIDRTSPASLQPRI